jgi:hypothetical protein
VAQGAFACGAVLGYADSRNGRCRMRRSPSPRCEHEAARGAAPGPLKRMKRFRDDLQMDAGILLMTEAPYVRARVHWARVSALASITIPELTTSNDRAHGTPSTSVSGEVEFTEFEGSAKNAARGADLLRCDLLNMESCSAHQLLGFDATRSHSPCYGRLHEQPAFQAVACTNNLLPYSFGKETPEGKSTLTYDEIAGSTVQDAPAVAVDLVA